MKALHEGHVVCLLSDRLVGDASGVEVTFFDGQALMPAGPATLAVRSGAPLMTAAIYFGKSADAHRLVFRPALHLPTEGRFQQRARAITQLLAVELEELVRAAPSQWHIVQPNWLDDPPLRSGGRRGAVAASPNRSPL